MAEEYKSLHPLKYYRDYYSHDIRPDGREFFDFRPIIVNVGSITTADGSAIAKVGKSTVICGIKAELCRPKPESPKEGFLITNLELPSLCSSKFKPGSSNEQAQVLTQLIANIIENSKCINLEELCILKDKLAWCLYTDLICLDYDGSVLDACLIALMACLKSVTLPHIDYDPALDIKQANLEDRKPLNVYSTPITTTFAIFDDKIILSDPSNEEENLCTGTVSVAVLNDQELCSVHKPGGSPLSEQQVMDCIEKSKLRSRSVKKLIDAALRDMICQKNIS
ncbi:exosome complex component RRP43-like [Anthonomus grandis grandis]|uniref:exosome complex component RRP43-like n=1 Tax=Anthonomus grandis grandis TaxID=2921223 RepID=UPI0021652CC4|nr:exosome complex component RRP43-like [Anthonomus grandis grandis]